MLIALAMAGGRGFTDRVERKYTERKTRKGNDHKSGINTSVMTNNLR
jgi:hypothetical protein